MKQKALKILFVMIACLLFGYAARSQSVPTSPVNSPKDLDAGRVKIDSLDNLLMKVLGERERIAGAIGAYKAKNHIPPLQEARFKQVVDKSIAAGKKEGLSAEFITEIMNSIHKESLRIEGDSTAVRR
jgi:chorismate mutase